MSGGSDRSFKVLLLLGASAAAAVVLNRALHWIFESSVTDTKSITKETESVRSENLSIEKNKEQKDTNCLLEKKNSIVIENRTEIIEPNLLRLEMASVKENSTNKQTYHLASSEEKQEVKCNHSWSELIDEDISEVESLKIKESSSENKQQFIEKSRAHHDSGVVSPHNDGVAENRVQSPELKDSSDSNRSSGIEEVNCKMNNVALTPIKTTNDEERSELDGGLGSSVCGEDIGTNTNFTDVVSNQVEKDATKKLNAASTADAEITNAQMKSQRQATGGSDSGQGSEADDGIRMAYHFYIPNHLCGKMIGKRGETVKQFKSETKCSIQLQERSDSMQGRYRDNRRYRSQNKDQYPDTDPFELQICMIEGTRNGIDRCLELIREKFPLQQYQELSLEQINLPQTSSSGSLILSTQIDNGNQETSSANAQQHEQNTNSNVTAPTQLGLDQGAMHEVYVSAIVSGGHVFLQQPNHPTYYALSRLETCMYNVYTRLAVPDVPKDVLEPGLVCAASWNQQWYRVQVVNYDPSGDSCNVRFLDYGGYYTFSSSDLKQIRTDFLALPFQALEVYLGNVIPPDQNDWPLESAVVLEELVANQVISGRMLGVTEDYIPIVHLYGWINVDGQDASSNSQQSQQPRLLNRELVDRGVAQWTEHIIAST